MEGRYVGLLDRDDPLQDFLRRVLRDRLHVPSPRPIFQVFRLTGTNEVYGYREATTGFPVVCKFYGSRHASDRHRAARLAAHEFDSLRTLRGYGLVGSPHHVVRPLAMDPDINVVLALEYYPGERFSRAIDRSVHAGDDTHLLRRLTSLAYFLATQHHRTATGDEIDFDADCRYFGRLTERLRRCGRLGDWGVDELCWLRDCWRERPAMWQGRQVWLHGDATPANFIFGDGIDVGAIDLERLRRGDPAFDVGRVTGELQHAFMPGGDRHRAEPFIAHFLRQYAGHFPDREGVFGSVTARLPFFMALNLLRIAANGYLGDDYAQRLVRQARRLLHAS